jgi:serine/threonine-protein kinase HipA
MTSEAYVWIWLPKAISPVVCGRLRADSSHYEFVYGRSYLSLKEAIPLDPQELPLQEESFRPDVGELHGVLRDAAPDAWGRRVLLYRTKENPLTELDFLLLADNDRIGALGLSIQSKNYHSSQIASATLSDLSQAAQKIEEGLPLSAELDAALLHGSSVGGARPKALLDDDHSKWIAKFSSSTDQYPVVRFEHAALWLAGQCGIRTPKIKLTQLMGKDVLLVQRFDRIKTKKAWARKFMTSALSALKLHETEARLASYPDLAGFIRRFGSIQDLRELYARMVFNILIGNTDDHARNHSLFWDGTHYQLTPAYDICPILRSGLSAGQAMIVGQKGTLSTLNNALSDADQFELSQEEARQIQQTLIEKITSLWSKAVTLSKLTHQQSDVLRQMTVLSPGCYF